MVFTADLHVHSHLSRATSRECNLEGLHRWAQLKGIRVVGTGDFTHPAWFAEIGEKLVGSVPGLFRLRAEFARAAEGEVPAACRGPVEFMLTAEISHIYKRGGRVRKVHSLVLAPDLETVAGINRRLDALGNLKSDGRPILGLDPRDLLDIVLETNPDAYLIPAHIWTPWFSMLGSKSGFDSLEECFGDLSPHVFAVETGLSSDPPMNWRVSALDRLVLVSNSDLHSPQRMARNANIFRTDPDFFAMRDALRDKDPERFGGTLDLFPEEGKYHLDGHRKCGVCFEPEESLSHDNLCPVCGKPLVLGVLHRVTELADRPKGARPDNALPCEHIIPLPELLAELFECGENTKKVQRAYRRLLERLGPELRILRELPPDDIERVGPALIGEAVRRVRDGNVVRRGGFDGEYGVIRVFAPGEKDRVQRQMILLAVQRVAPARPAPASPPVAAVRESAGPAYRLGVLRKEIAAGPGSGGAASEPTQPLLFRLPGGEILEGLTVAQRQAVTTVEAPVLVVAGPGTGKTRALTRRIAWLVRCHGAAPEQILAVTFTNRAAREMTERLGNLLSPAAARRLTVGTFHAFCLDLLRGRAEAAGLPPDFRLLDSDAARDLAVDRLGLKPAAAREFLNEIEAARRELRSPHDVPGYPAYAAALEAAGLVELSSLVPRVVGLLDAYPHIRDALALEWICVDEFQDVSPDQYALVRRLRPDGRGLFVIGDPDQAIYGFRGSSGTAFTDFQRDYPDFRHVVLETNFRSDAWIVRTAAQVLAPGRSAISASAEAAWQRQLRVRVHEAPTAAAEAEFITHEIEKWVGGVAHFSMNSDRVAEAGMGGMTFGDVAVLVRLHALVGPLAEALSRLGLPVQVVRKSPVFRSGPGRALLGVIQRAPLELRRRKAADALASLAATVSPDDAFCLAGDAWNELVRLAEQADGSLDALLDRLVLRADADGYSKSAEKVALLSIHAAKGLEFPAVFLAGCEDGILPYIPPGAEGPEDLAEERRLFYVAMTRAERVLYLTGAAKRQLFGKTLVRGPSRFLEAIDPNVLELMGPPARARRKRPRERQLEFDFG
ncbi:MAG: UvrD-helicase domain-containing protein [Kiritimatiellaeota bacterium]|nr:UvrD-helicase domain-containing protein [Kiritimatiellota bacterium]